MYKFVAGFALMVVIFGGCKNDLNKTGYDLLHADEVTPHKAILDKTRNKAFTVTDEIQRTDEPAYNLLGTFNDPVFGKTTTDFACQFRLDEYRDFKNATLDSLVLNFVYMEKFGDTITPQKLRVYELASDLYASPYKYYQKEDLKSRAKSEVLAELNYIPKFKLDSLSTTYGSTKAIPKDTVIQDIKFRMSPSLAQKLMAADSVTRSDNDKFINYFKGLYVEAGDLNQGGTVMRVKTLASGSIMKLYYHKENDTTKYILNYKINSSAARVSHFVHDYLATAFFTNLYQKVNQDSLIYLQTTGGLASKIFIPGLDSWKDSVGCAINKAELIFKIDPVVSDTAKYKPPYRLILSAVDAKDSLYFPSDLNFSQAYYGGIYNKADGTYRFNLAKHMQELITGKKENFGFYLSTENRNSSYNRVALKGATSKVGIQMEITYSKYK